MSFQTCNLSEDVKKAITNVNDYRAFCLACLTELEHAATDCQQPMIDSRRHTLHIFCFLRRYQLLTNYLLSLLDALTLRSSGSSSNLSDLHRYEILCFIDVEFRSAEEDVNCSSSVRSTNTDEWLSCQMALQSLRLPEDG